MLVAVLLAACGREAPEPRDWRETPFEPLASESGAIYSLVIETGLAELARLDGLSGKPFDADPLDVRPVLAEQGRPVIPSDVRAAIRSHLKRNVRFLDPLQRGLPEGAATFFGPIVLRGSERHIAATFVDATSEYIATFVVEPYWRVTRIKDEIRLCPVCPESQGPAIP